MKHYNGISYYYDDLGNLIHRELPNGEVQNYFYDLHDQLVKVEIFKKDGSKETWAYHYDSLGRRIGKGRLKENGGAETLSDGLKDHACLNTPNSKDILDSEITFLWDGSHLLREQNSDGLYTYIYTDADSYEPLAQIRDWTDTEGEAKQQTSYFHCDQIGIPREMTDKDGNLLWFGDYYGWGKLKSETNITETAHQPFRLQNQYCDQETGLHYNFFRYYEPDAGRFVNQDPIGLMGGSNFYLFALNTQGWVDPWGLDCSSDAQELRKNMNAKNVPEPNYKNSAHHIVMSNSMDTRMVALREKMQTMGIKINDAANSVFLPTSSAVKDKCNQDNPGACSAHAHSKVHTNTYKKNVYDRLKDINDPVLFKKELRAIGRELQSGTFSI
nr:RHS repeat-associated core domain-containing protein [Neisseria canis]